MKWIKNIFKKKDQPIETIPEAKPEHIVTDDRNVCDFCGFEIFGEQKTVSKAGKRYHLKPCWRVIQKMAKKEAFS